MTVDFRLRVEQDHQTSTEQGPGAADSTHRDVFLQTWLGGDEYEDFAPLDESGQSAL